MSKFSIILPVHNGGTFVKGCVHSIVAQENKDFDLLILENKSNDGTGEWLQSLMDERIKIFPSTQLLTIEENWARIVDLPKNEFITIIGHDDLLLPGYLQKMEELIQEHPAASLYQSHFTYIDGDGRFIRECLPMDEKQSGHEFLACQMRRTMDSMGTGYMMRSKDYDSIGGIPAHYPNLIFADYELWLKLTLRSYKATTRESLFQYRVYNNTSLLTNAEQYQRAFGQYIHFIYGLVKENEAIAGTGKKYGYEFIMYFCESLSHRILKSPEGKDKTRVDDFIKKCTEYASLLIPGQEFNPLDKKRIKLAKQLDATYLGRAAFRLYKKLKL